MRGIMFALLTFVTASLTSPVQPQHSAADQERARIHYRLGLESLRMEQFDEAAREFQQAIDIAHRFALAYYGLGRARMGLHQYPAAIAAYTTCRDLYSAQSGQQFTNALAANQARQDELLELQELSRQNAAAPQTQSSQYAQRQIQNRVRLLQDNLQRGKNNIELDTTQVPAFVLLALGSAYFRAEQFANAERTYREAIALDSTIGEAHNNLAVICMLSGRLDEADKEVRLAEKSGFIVHPQFKQDLKDKRKSQAEP